MNQPAAKKKYKVRSKVVPYPGMNAWHFAYVDKKQAGELKEKYGKGAKGFGSLPVIVTLGKSTWKTSIFPDKHSGTFLLPLKAAVRRAEAIDAGDTISFILDINL